MSVVIDASVALKWVIPESDSEAAGALRDEELIAPSLWLAEAANALWRHVRQRAMTLEEAINGFAILSNAPVRLAPVEAHLDPALRIAVQTGHPVYDCVYLAVALSFETHVITADRGFVSAVAGGYAGRVRLLGAE